MMNNPRPIGTRKTVQFVVALTLLAWATQTLLSQWGFGGIILPAAPQKAPMAEPPAPPVLEVRSDATIDGSQVTLRQICRWAPEDEPVVAPVADTVLARLSHSRPVRQVSVREIKAALHDVGANLSQLHFSGSASCAVRRSEVDDATFARLLSHENEPGAAAAAADAAAADTATTQPAAPGIAPEEPKSVMVADAPQTPLKDLLVSDLCDRLQLTPEQVQVTFEPRDDATLILTSPRCRFDIDASRAAGLGNIAWNVTIRTDTTSRVATLSAKALAWKDQLVITRPLSKGQKLIASDLVRRRGLVDTLADDSAGATDAPADPAQLVGQPLARNVKKGDVLSGDDIRLAPLVTRDQVITVALRHQGMTIETVARALETGARGEIVRARNEATGQVYSVVVTAPGAGEIRATSNAEKVVTTN